MSQQLNFAELKQRISIVQGAKLLGLTLTEDGQTLRCACPVCEGDDRTLSFLEEPNTFKCFKSGKYGSVLDLVCHVKQIGLREAGQWLNAVVDEMKNIEAEEQPDLLAPLEKLPQLDPNDDEVKGIGLKPEVAEKVGVGVAKKGVLRGKIGVPLYMDGEIVGFMGIPKGTEVWLPKNLQYLVKS